MTLRTGEDDKHGPLTCVASPQVIICMSIASKTLLMYTETYKEHPDNFA